MEMTTLQGLEPRPEPLASNVRLRLDKVISLAAAKLLGVPFTWGYCVYAYRYEHTPDGLIAYMRDITAETYQDNWRLCAWKSPEGMMDRPYKLVVVEFDDEQNPDI